MDGRPILKEEGETGLSFDLLIVGGETEEAILEELEEVFQTRVRVPDTSAGSGSRMSASESRQRCPICGRWSLCSDGRCDCCGADLGGVNVLLIRAARARLEGSQGLMEELNQAQLELQTLRRARCPRCNHELA